MSTDLTTPGASSLAVWIRRGLRAGLVGGLVLGGLALVMLRPDLHMVEQVRFEGVHRVSPVALRHLADLPNGTAIWEVDPEQVARAVERHPWVKRAVVTRELPATVRVEVVEYTPVAMLRWDGLRYLDADGTVILGARGDELGYPIISGVDSALERAHPALPRLAVRDAIRLIELLDARGLVPPEQVSELHFSRTRGFTLTLTSGAELLLSLDDPEPQLDRLAALVAQGVDLTAPVHVDLAPAKVAIVRPLPLRAKG